MLQLGRVENVRSYFIHLILLDPTGKKMCFNAKDKMNTGFTVMRKSNYHKSVFERFHYVNLDVYCIPQHI